MAEIEITKTTKSVDINGYPFTPSDFNRIKTRILRNQFNGPTSLLRGMSGTTVIRDGNKIKLGKPSGFPKESWSYTEWVEHADGWTVYAEGTLEEWKTAFETI